MLNLNFEIFLNALAGLNACVSNIHNLIPHMLCAN